jgi:hypothetical protein
LVHDRRQQEFRDRSDVADEVRATQVDPTAGIWVCRHCDRRIQVITESDHEKVQPFTCVCGTEMEPGEEHTAPGPDLQKGDVIDD